MERWNILHRKVFAAILSLFIVENNKINKIQIIAK